VLDELQGALATLFQRAEPVVGDAGASLVSARHVTGNDRLSPAEQVDIYRRQFWLRHHDALLEDYPGLALVVGDDAFEAFVRAYLVAHPPRTPSLRDLGADVPAFAARHGGFPPRRRAIAVEMARYEHAFVDIFDAAEPPRLDVAKIQSVSPEGWSRARLVLHPHLVTMTVRHPVHRVRYDLKAGAPVDVDAAAVPAPEPFHLALYRKDLVVHYEELEPEAHRLLEALRAGAPLAPACAALAEGLAPEDAALLEARVGAWFQRWTASAWIVDVELA
jgi:hypothetical protein